MQKYHTLSLLLDKKLEIKKKLEDLDKLLNQGKIGYTVYESIKKEYVKEAKKIQERLESEKNRFMEDYTEVVGRMKTIEQSFEELEARHLLGDITSEEYEKKKSRLEDELSEISPLHEGMMSLIEKIEEMKCVGEDIKPDEMEESPQIGKEIGYKVKENPVIFKKKTKHNLKTVSFKENEEDIRTKDKSSMMESHSQMKWKLHMKRGQPPLGMVQACNKKVEFQK